MKELTWHYVIEGPQLTTQQVGQRRIIAELFDALYLRLYEARWWTLPEGYRILIDISRKEHPDRPVAAARLAADLIAGFTEEEAIGLHRRLTGVDSGPLMATFRPL